MKIIDITTISFAGAVFDDKGPMPLILFLFPVLIPALKIPETATKYRVVRTLRMTLCLYSDNILSTCMPLTDTLISSACTLIAAFNRMKIS